MGTNGNDRRKTDRRKEDRRQLERRSDDQLGTEAEDERVVALTPELEYELARVRSTIDARAALDAERAEQERSARRLFRRRRRA